MALPTARTEAPQRLSPLDASYLRLETPTAPMHTAGLVVFEPGLTFGDVSEALEARLDHAPLARKRLREVPLGGRPAWVDDPDFDLSYHLRHAALPAPGDRVQLGEFLSRLLGRQLDRRRPLWEMYLIEGLEGGRVGLFRKVHLAAASSRAADPLTVLLQDAPDVGGESPPSRWRPTPPARTSELAVDALRERAEELAEVGRRVGDLVAAPRRLVGTLAGATGSVVGMAARAVRLAPDSPLNVRLSPHRRCATVRVDLERLRAVRRAFGGTINDAIVTVVGDAVGRLLRGRGHDTHDLDLRVMVPVRVARGDGGVSDLAEELPLGTGVVGVLAPLPVMEMDAVARLYRVMGELAGLRDSRQAVAATDLVRLAGFAPPNLHAMAARLASAEQRYNVALSNAPGPQSARFLRGVRMEESYPFIPLAGDAALSVAVTSYQGEMFVGLLGDRVGVPDLPDLADALTAAVEDLYAAAMAHSDDA